MIDQKILTEAIAAGLEIGNMSLAELVALDPEFEAAFYDGLTQEEWVALSYDWDFWARPKQQIPDPFPYIWLLQTGRGFGKTRTCAETVRERVESGKSRRIGVLAPTAAVARDVVVEGESGLLSSCPPWNKPLYESTKRRLTWANGARLIMYSSEDPDLIRGGEFDFLWIEEATSLKNAKKCFSNAIFALRNGRDPHCIISTTPKRRHEILEIIKGIAAKTPQKVHITRGHTLENKSNLADDSLELMLETYGGTTLGKQELEGEELIDVDGAFWTKLQLDKLRVTAHPKLKKIVCGVDPAISDKKRSDDNGIIIAGRGVDDHLYLLADYSIHGNGTDWGDALFQACLDFPVSHIHVETVRGGNLIRRNIDFVWTEKNREREERGEPTVLIPQISEINSQELDKWARIELFAGLWEQGKAHSVGELAPRYPKEGKEDENVETEMCDWSPIESKYSPNRIDGLINCAEKLFPEREKAMTVTSAKPIKASRNAYAPKRPQSPMRRAI